MRIKYRLLTTLGSCLIGLLPAMAQTSGTNSSYSRFGLGLPNTQSQGFSRSMGGVGQGIRDGIRVNSLNPASYSAIDSVTFLFDVGMSLQRTRMSVGNNHLNVNNTDFDYVTAGFHLLRNVGMSLGFQPFTSIGYSFTQDQKVATDPYTGQNISNSFSFNGSGGLHLAFAGIGWKPFKWVSIGANAGILWGNIKHQVVQTFAENGTSVSNYSSLRTFYDTSVKTWKGDVGIQFMAPLNKQDQLTLGATIGIGHKIGGESTMLRTVLAGDTITKTADKAYQLPMTYSFGAAWKHADKLTLALDATLEQWGECTTPQYNSTTGVYAATKGDYSNRLHVNAGVEYIPARYDRKYLRRINYRAGAYYATPFQKIAMQGATLDGPSEIGITAGLGLPISNGITRMSLLNPYTPSYVNIGVEWARRAPSSSQLITENVFRINIGLTFNENWFMKWKFQ